MYENVVYPINDFCRHSDKTAHPFFLQIIGQGRSHYARIVSHTKGDTTEWISYSFQPHSFFKKGATVKAGKNSLAEFFSSII